MQIQQIQTGLKQLELYLNEFEIKLLGLQAGAVKNALKVEAQEFQKLLIKTRADLKRLVAKGQKEADIELVRAFNKLSQQDITEQFTTYNKAYKAGIIKSAPVIPQAIQLQALDNLTKERVFVYSSFQKIEQRASGKIMGYVQNAYVNRDSPYKAGVINDVAIDMIQNGVSITSDSGRVYKDVAGYIRNTMANEMNQDFLQQEVEIFESLDIDEENKWYETSSHFGSRPEHAVWQGKVFKGYNAFVQATGYGEVDGLGGINCRHTFYPFIPGISEREFKHYNQKENEKQYLMQQEQRKIERNIREYKRQQVVFADIGTEQQIARANAGVSRWQSEMRDFIDKTGLRRQRFREQI